MPGKKPSNKNKGKGKAKAAPDFILREDGQEYAQAGRMLGNGRLEAICFDGQTRMAHIRGKLLKRVWIATGDIIIVALRDFQDGKVDVIHKYSSDQAKKLKSMGEIPSNTKLTIDVALEDDDDDVEFVFEDI
jgi:translation initiation factor 1A